MGAAIAFGVGDYDCQFACTTQEPQSKNLMKSVTSRRLSNLNKHLTSSSNINLPGPPVEDSKAYNLGTHHYISNLHSQYDLDVTCTNPDDVLNDFFVEWQMSLCLDCWFWFDFADE